MPKAINLTYGDFIIIEISLIHYLKDMDLSMQSGQYMSKLLGKVEYELAQIEQAELRKLQPGFNPEKDKEQITA